MLLAMTLEEGHLDEFGDGDPGEDCCSSAAEVIMMLVLDAEEVVVFHRVSFRPWTQDLEEADEKGMPLLAGAEELFQANPREKRARTGFRVLFSVSIRCRFIYATFATAIQQEPEALSNCCWLADESFHVHNSR